MIRGGGHLGFWNVNPIFDISYIQMQPQTKMAVRTSLLFQVIMRPRLTDGISNFPLHSAPGPKTNKQKYIFRKNDDGKTKMRWIR